MPPLYFQPKHLLSFIFLRFIFAEILDKWENCRYYYFKVSSS